MRLGIASKLKKALKPGGLKNKVLPYLWYYTGCAALVRGLSRFRPIKGDKIVFTSFHGRGFGDHQKAIVLELIRRGFTGEIVWLSDEPERVRPIVPPEVRVASMKPFSAIRELSTARVWCDSQGLNKFIVWGLGKRPGQTYIQTYHGSLGIKRVGADLPTDGSVQLWVKIMRRDAEMIDELISNATWESETVYRNRFFGYGTIRLFGHPRNDVLFGPTTETHTRVCSGLALKGGERLVLVAQTWRNGHDLSPYLRNCSELRAACERRFGGSWRVLVRFHPNLIPYVRDLDLGDGVVDATRYPDMQDLLVVSDVLVSDYSSCMFDFMLTRRPVFVYATDRAKYEHDRGFYYPLSATPFPIATTEAELAEKIAAFDETAYRAGVEAFLEEKGCVEDGHATERVVDLIEERTR